ncbi:MAG: nitrite/sulfite reductase [Planctomycetes bacterium]|nr:nitrite/sulfite reductase [Planctomycetota bacterium]
MLSLDDPKTFGPARLGFADEKDVDLFVDTLEKFERGEIDSDAWRSFRLLNGVYSQRQDEWMMVRVKIPQGILTADQLRALAEVAERWSNGKGHVTTRQNVQFHFVKLEHAEEVLRRCAEAGLTTREACGNSVRNITTCPFAGTSAVEPFDPTPYAEALTRHLLGGPWSSSLPRKFKIAFGGCCGTDCVHAAINDLGFLARLGGTGGLSARASGGLSTRASGGLSARALRGFRLTIGGGTAVLPRSGFVAHEFLPATEVLEAAEAVVRVFHRIGDPKDRHRARLKYVIERLGQEAFLREYEREREAIRSEGGRPLIPDVGEDRDASPGQVPISSLQDGRPKSRDLSRDPRPAASDHRSAPAPTDSVPVHDSALPRSGFLPRPGYTEFARTNVRPQKQPGFSTVIVRLPLGDVTTGQFRSLADLAGRYGEGEARTTHEQNVVLRYIPDDRLANLHAELETTGLARPGARTVVDVTSCPGAASCRIAVTASRGLASLLGEFLESRPDLVAKAPSLHLKISGCPNGCGQHHIAGIGFQGGVRRFGKTVIPQYHVFLGGGISIPETVAQAFQPVREPLLEPVSQPALQRVPGTPLPAPNSPAARLAKRASAAGRTEGRPPAEGGATFGRLAARIPARRVPSALERLIDLYATERIGDEAPEEFFARLPLDRATKLLADLEEFGPEDVTPQDLVDLGEEKAYAVQVSAGECAV